MVGTLTNTAKILQSLASVHQPFRATLAQILHQYFSCSWLQLRGISKITHSLAIAPKQALNFF
jgi:hypothetical protein